MAANPHQQASGPPTRDHWRASRTLVWGVVCAGLGVRGWLWWTTLGHQFDMFAFRAAGHIARTDVAHLYSRANAGPTQWPYLPGMLPWLALSDLIAGDAVRLFARLAKLPLVAADFALAAATGWWWVRHHGPRLAWLAPALILLGPMYFFESGFHVQFDQVATCLGLLGVMGWLRRLDGWPVPALVCGLLLGAGASVKTMPILLLAAILPSARSRREGALLLCGALVPVLPAAVYLVADRSAFIDAMSYHGVVGFGGLSMLVQPDLLRQNFLHEPVALSAASDLLQSLGTPLTLASTALIALLVHRGALTPDLAAVAVITGISSVGVNFSPHYTVWLPPFLILAGRLGTAVVATLTAAVPVIVYNVPHVTGSLTWPRWSVYWLYAPGMAAVFIVGAAIYFSIMVPAVRALMRPRDSGLVTA